MNPSLAAPGSQASLREANRLRVLETLREQGAMTQVEIAGSTGLSPATVSNMVKELDGAGAVELAPSIRNGRRAVLVSLATGNTLLAGIAFGDRDVRVAVATGPRDVIGRQRMPLPSNHNADEGMERAARLLYDLVEKSGKAMTDVKAVGVGIPAPVDSVSGQVGSESIMPGWRGVDVADELAGRLGAPVLVDNTANLGALGELRIGALQGVQDGVFLKLSHGIGAGLVIGGEVFRGSAGTAGEIGHLTIDEHGQICRCGNRGCLETFIGAQALGEALAVSHGRLTLRDIIARAQGGDVGCRRVLEDAGRHLGVAVAGLVNLLNPSVIVIGGQLALVGDLIVDPLRAAIERSAIPSAAASVTILSSELATEADVVGGIVAAEALHAASDALKVTIGSMS
ncbi:ROK family transcriptional regulator [Terracoccus luteus]|uniref:Putative NBD/HSP70 family sugar kinase n=1 Tax=Terracoccus luteus TaxID=53356 RepID=A0A839PU40_9MICO|nr:ROK family transcriptional regulator [Terracoccus luteus]MBB2986553.1 putative NBD/HSP70 family sugar kinase [Terracoccus luteus]MCP2171858.1 putative NBD/HSP70 family sugar kinase [Terracoccus luteus]